MSDNDDSIRSVFSVPSVFKGEASFISFFVDGEGGEQIEVGKLMGKGGVLSFEGNAEESAKIFFDEVIKRNKHLLTE